MSGCDTRPHGRRGAADRGCRGSRRPSPGRDDRPRSRRMFADLHDLRVVDRAQEAGFGHEPTTHLGIPRPPIGQELHHDRHHEPLIMARYTVAKFRHRAGGARRSDRCRRSVARQVRARRPPARDRSHSNPPLRNCSCTRSAMYWRPRLMRVRTGVERDAELHGDGGVVEPLYVAHHDRLTELLVKASRASSSHRSAGDRRGLIRRASSVSAVRSSPSGRVTRLFRRSACSASRCGDPVQPRREARAPLEAG